MIKIIKDNKLEEKSFFEVSLKDVITTEYIKSLNKYSDQIGKELISGWIKKYQNQAEIEVPNPNNPNELIWVGDLDYEYVKNSINFRKWLINELTPKFYEVKKELKEIIKDNKVIIYREMKVREDWFDYLKKEGKHLGVYWTYREDLAEAYWGVTNMDISNKFDVKFIKSTIISEVEEQYINWVQTYRADMDLYFYYEKEITLFKNTPLIIKGLIINEKNIDISSIENKIFYA